MSIPSNVQPQPGVDYLQLSQLHLGSVIILRRISCHDANMLSTSFTRCIKIAYKNLTAADKPYF